MAEKLSDNEVHDRLVAASDLLVGLQAETIRGQTALGSAQLALHLLQMGLLAATDRAKLIE